jgi:hypothetical protein
MSASPVLRAASVSALMLAASMSGLAQVGRTEVQSRPMPGRDQPPRFGTAALTGRVVDGATGAAIARARVRIVGGPGARPSVLTDASGAFAFTNLPAGGYTLMAEKSTYLAARHPAPGRTVRSAPRPLLLRDGEALDGVTVAMFRGGAIAGRVLDAHGDPMEYADVRVMRVAGAGGRPMGVGGNSSNDLGEFRISRLEPGRYLLMVVPRRTSQEEPVPDAQPPAQPLPTYYPGVLALDQAQPITLDRGQTISGLDIVLAEGTPAIVTGTVLTSGGEPVTAGAFVSARGIVKDLPGFVDSGGSAGVRPDGTFRLSLAPGEHRIEARVNQPSQGGPPRPETEQFGVVRVAVTAGGAEAVSIVVGRGATASGRVIFEGTIPVPSVPEQYRPQLFMSETGECRSGRTQFAADWTFRVEGLSGTCSAPPSVGLGGWTLKELLHEGENLLEQPLTFEPGQELRNLQVVFTDKRTELTFRVVDEQGQRTREYVAIVFPASAERRSQFSRYVRTYVPPSLELMMMQSAMRGRGMPPPATSASPRGARLPPREAIGGLPPGDYYAVALDDIETDAVRDPAVMERLIPGATRISLPEGGTADVALRRVKLNAH